MSDILKQLQPRKVFEYFEVISNIPRSSGNEKVISDYMMDFAASLGLEAKQDEAYNVYIKKPATKGYEQAPTVILQGHLDMVCEKNKDVVHDFEKEGLSLFVEGDYIGAKGTTLGGDNGVAIAYQMAVLADSSLKHPAIECLMTTDEERGMSGVANLKPEYLQGKVLLNLDTDVEGEFLVSCAGGAKAHLTLPLERQVLSNEEVCYKLTINGLRGGHSGADIHFERANAHLLMGRMLNVFSQHCKIRMISLVGGTKDNVITRECECVFAVPQGEIETLKKLFEERLSVIQGEYSVQDPNITAYLEETQSGQEALSMSSTLKSIQLLMALPNGIMGYDKHLDNLVQTSLNLGILQMQETKLELGIAVRSSVASRKQEILEKLEAISRVFQADFYVRGDYPAWQYQPKSRIRELASALYQEMYGRAPSMTAIHAGLECGFIAEKLPHLDMISFGPDIKHIHSPQEVVSISSMARVYEYLVKLLENLVAY